MPSLEKILKVQLVMILCFTMPNLMMDIFIPQLHTLTTLVLYATIAYTATYTLRRIPKYNKVFLFYVLFFIIYSIVIYFDLTTDRKYPLSKMLGCPNSVIEFITMTLIIMFFILQVPIYQKVKDFGFLVKYYILFNLPLVLLYISIVGVAEIQFDESITDISTLTLASTASNCLLLALIFKDSFTQNKIVNNIILLIVFLATMSVWGDLGKRGAILWFFITLIVYLILKSRNIKATVFKCLLIFAAIYMMLPAIISMIENFSPFLAERVHMTLVEGHTSGRMEEEGAYGYAIKQFMDSPVFGSYFRIVTNNPTWRGLYPHNIILELLITFGIVGLIPFLYFLRIIFTKLRKSFCYDISSKNSIEKVIGILFLNAFFSLMSTGTILLSLPFWINIAILLTTIDKKNDKLFNRNTAQK